MLFIIDNQSSFIKKFKRNFRSEQNIEYRFIDHNEPLVIKPDEQVDGIILSGGKGSPRKIKKAIPSRKYENQIHFQIDGGLTRHPFPETDKVLEFWNMVKNISSKLDIRITKEHRWSTSDICFVEGEKLILDGFGLSPVSILQRISRIPVQFLWEVSAFV